VTIRMAPENIPADPNPAIARPTMKATEVGAVAQIMEPTSKIAKAIRKVHLTL
jgi:hypothetical protein